MLGAAGPWRLLFPGHRWLLAARAPLSQGRSYGGAGAGAERRLGLVACRAHATDAAADVVSEAPPPGHAAAELWRILAELEAAPVAPATTNQNKGEVRRLQREAIEAFEEAVPELLRTGGLVAAALRLPLHSDRETSSLTEQSMKRLLMILARRLHAGAAGGPLGTGLPPAELPRVPALLQRVGFSSQPFFDDFCLACGACWSDLAPRELSKLLLAAEDYALLHPTKGTALGRVADAIAESFQGDGGALYPPEKLLALCNAALAVRARSTCDRMLVQLRVATVSAAERLGAQDSGSAAASLLAAVAELHAAVEPVPSTTIQALLTAAREGFDVAAEAARSDSEEKNFFATPQGVVASFRACSLCYWVAPDAAKKLLEVIMEYLKLMKVDRPLLCERALRAGTRLPGPLRRVVAERLLDNDLPRDKRALGIRLALLHDVPALASSLGEKDECVAYAGKIGAFLAAAFGDGTTSSARGLDAGTLVWAYTAAANAAEALRGEGSDASSVAASLTQRAKEALSALDAVGWANVSVEDIRVLSRVEPRLEATELAAHALRNAGQVQDISARVAILHAACGIIETGAVTAACESLGRDLQRSADKKTLCIAEAALRRGPLAHSEAHAHGFTRLLAEIHRQLFRVTLDSPPAWCRTPARGFVQYVERSVALIGQKRPAGDSVEDAAPEATAPEVADSGFDVTIFEEAPMSRKSAGSVKWHTGLEAWEVRVESKGKRVVHGFFRPHDATAAGREAARLQAEGRLEALERDLRIVAPRTEAMSVSAAV